MLLFEGRSPSSSSPKAGTPHTDERRFPSAPPHVVNERLRQAPRIKEILMKGWTLPLAGIVMGAALLAPPATPQSHAASGSGFAPHRSVCADKPRKNGED